MSVLIEALCLVVNRLSLELSFPNGADGFEAQANGLEAVRYVVSNDDVIAVSVLDPAHLESLLVPMMEAGLIYTDADGTGDFVFVDMELGATGPCAWLKTEAHQHGFRTALRAGAVGDDYMVTPAGWSPQQSWNLQRYDLRDAGPDRVLPLGHDKAGKEAVLDFETGRVISGPDVRSPIVTVGEPTLPSPPAPAVNDVRLAAAQRLLGEKGIPYRMDTVAKEIVVLFALDDDITSREIECMRSPILPALEDARLRTALSVRADEDTLRYTVSLPCSVRTLQATDRFEQSFADDVHFDRETHTVSITITIARQSDEGWERAVERGFTTASAAGSRATMALADLTSK